MLSVLGTHYMVVDCGGGTVDITVHELCSYRGTLRELHTAVGGPWGSLGELSTVHLHCIFGCHCVNLSKVLIFVIRLLECDMNH